MEPRRPDLSKVRGCLEALVRDGKKYACIYANPPWPDLGRASHFERLEADAAKFIDELQRLPIRALGSAKSHLHLQVTGPHLAFALQVLPRWGYTHESVLVLPGGTERHAEFWRGASEFLILGVRGNLAFLHTNVDTDMLGAKTRENILAVLEQVSPGPYLDVFAQSADSVWTAGFAS